MMKPFAAALALISVAVTASGCCSSAETVDNDPILAAWAQLLPAAGCTIGDEHGPTNVCEPELVVRVVVQPDTPCPALRTPGESVRMDERPNPAKDDLKVRVCEAAVDWRKSEQAGFADSKRTVSWSALARHDAASRVAVIGDTGCRNEKGQEGCDASGGPDDAIGRAWSFARVAAAAAETKPGLVIHVGDFRYRHEGAPDSWEDWKKDVFDPAAPLLAAAPWVTTRGNHDLCFDTKGGKGFKGNGWPLFFGPKRGDNAKNCRDIVSPKAATPPALPPYALDVAETLRLVVLDSSNSYYGCAEWSRAFDDWTRQGLAGLFRPADRDKRDPRNDRTDAKKQVWLVTHYPVWHAEEDPAALCRDGNPGYDAMRTKLAPLLLNPDGRVGAILSGDIHHFEVLRVVWPDGRPVGPTEYVAGHGGAQASDLPTSPRQACDPSRLGIFEIRKEFPSERASGDGLDAPGEPVVVRGRAVCGYGFLDIERRGYEWRFTAKFLDAASVPPAVFSMPAGLDGVPLDRHLVVTRSFDADVSSLKPRELEGWRVIGGTDGAAVGKITLLACDRSDHRLEAIVGIGEQSGYAAVPASALRRIGDRAVAVLGRTGDQIRTDSKAQHDFTPPAADKSIAELGEACSK